jgi:hypothetical protein
MLAYGGQWKPDISRMAEMIRRGSEAGVKALDREAARAARPLRRPGLGYAAAIRGMSSCV